MNPDCIKEIPYFLDKWAENVADCPDEIILVDDSTRGISRKQADELSGKVYAYLKKMNISKDDIVMLCLPRGYMPIIAALGVWKAGAAVVIVEDTYAPDRIAYIKKDCSCKVEIDINLWMEIMHIDSISGYETADVHDAAFAVYTSGTTGNPKGILHEYGQIALNTLSVTKDGEDKKPVASRYALISPLNFVASIKIIIGMIKMGYTIFILNYDTVKNPVKLKKYIIENKIDSIFLSPSMIRAMGDDYGPYLKVIQTGSEPANGIYIDGMKIVNNYAMSECAFTLCRFLIDKPYDVCPVGKPVNSNIVIHILDEEGKEAATGEVGEICVENPFMRGYINLKEETERALINGMYHTGDLGKKDNNGNVILMGRANDMIKINGNRIEPAEIEAAVKKVLEIDWAAAKGFEEKTRSYVCAYYKDEVSFDEGELRAKLSDILPYYMIPSYFIKIDTIPLLPNGKLNRKSLPSPDKEKYVCEYIAPRTELEAQLCEAIARVLDIEKIGIKEDFYQLGGDSISSMKVLEELNLEDLGASDIYNGRSVEKIAEIYLSKLNHKASISPKDFEMEARKHPHALTREQTIVLDSALYAPHTVSWDIPKAYEIADMEKTEYVRDCLNECIEHSPVFSTIFGYSEDGRLLQWYEPKLCPKVKITDVSDEELENIKKEYMRPFKPFGEPGLRCDIFRTPEHSIILMDINHMICDGSSIAILTSNLVKRMDGEELPLDTYYSYLAYEENIKKEASYEEAKEYFVKKYEGVAWVNNLTPDKDEAGNKGASIALEQPYTTEQLTEFEAKNHLTKNSLMILCTLIALSKTTGKKDVLMSWVFHNRIDKVKANACGMVMKNLPVGIRFDEFKTTDELFEEISKESNDGIRHADYDWAIENESVYSNDTLFMVYETNSIMVSKGTRQRGIKARIVDATRVSGAIKRFAVCIYEDAYGTFVLLQYMGNKYSNELAESFGKAFSRALKTIVSSESPGSIKVSDLLDE